MPHIFGLKQPLLHLISERVLSAQRRSLSSAARPELHFELSSGLVFGLVFGLFASICIKSTAHAESPSSSDKPTSQLSSGLTLERFDRSVRPQDDLYRFVNGRWLDTFKIPSDKSRYGVFNDLNERARAQLKTIILELSEASSASGDAVNQETQQIKDAYRAFMNEERLDQLAATPIKHELDLIREVKDRQGLIKTIGALWALEVSGPIGGWVDQDAKSPTEYILYLMQSGLGLPDRDYYLKADDKFRGIRDAYLSYLEWVFEQAKLDHPKLRAAEVLHLETLLAEAQWTRAESRQRDKTYNRFTRDALNAKFKLSWDLFFSGVSPTLNDKAKAVIIRQPSYFSALSKLLESAPLSAWRSYLIARVFAHYAPYLSSTWVDRHFAFYGTKLRGAEANEPRWKRGIDHVQSVLGEVLGKLYVARHFKPEAKIRMKRLVDNLLVAFRGAINELEWMSDTTKAAAQEKLKRFTVKIGYPDRWRDYSALVIKPDDLIGNLRNAARLTLTREVNKLGGPIDRQEWFMPPQMVNAYYNPSMNEIVFPAAILQPPFFNMDADDAVNYGGIGAVIGHEISHGFDDQGRKSDGDGRLTDWWTPQDADRFQKRAALLASHYETYQPTEDAKINGQLTLGENIGDLGGLTVAYRAYILSLNSGKRAAPVLDGFTGPQRFFLSWAQVWACKYRDAELRRRLLTDPHSPAMYRVRGVVRQMPEFYSAFNLKESDKLYLPATQRVKIW